MSTREGTDPTRPHLFVGRADRACEVCSRPDRDPIHRPPRVGLAVELDGVGSDHRANLEELRRRVIEESGLDRPVPLVSTEIARLLVDLVGELGAVVLELELVRELGATRVE